MCKLMLRYKKYISHHYNKWYAHYNNDLINKLSRYGRYYGYGISVQNFSQMFNLQFI